MLLTWDSLSEGNSLIFFLIIYRILGIYSCQCLTHSKLILKKINTYIHLIFADPCMMKDRALYFKLLQLPLPLWSIDIPCWCVIFNPIKFSFRFSKVYFLCETKAIPTAAPSGDVEIQQQTLNTSEIWGNKLISAFNCFSKAAARDFLTVYEKRIHLEFCFEYLMCYIIWFQSSLK